MRMNRESGMKELARTRIIAIVRGVSEEHILNVAQALWLGGITVMEVTLNTEGALRMITQLQEHYGERMFIGAGTVLDLADAQLAVEAGASFIVTPNTDVEVIRYAAQHNIPIFPGAMTPTEIVQAWKAGATAVKIFPIIGLGLNYIKELQGPLSHIPMVAVGGVNETNIRDFFTTGCIAIGVGTSLIQPEAVQKGNFHLITEKAERLVRLSKVN